MKKRLVVFCHLLPAIISLLLLGAHFLRSGNILLTALSLLLVLGLGVREPLAARTVQVVLVLAVAVWFKLGFGLVAARLDAGTPWLRLAIIIGAVAALSLVAAVLFFSKELKLMYHLSDEQGENLPLHDLGTKQGDSGKKEITIDTEKQHKLFAAHYRKTILHTSSLIALLLMDYSIGLGMVTLIVIGVISSAFRRKIQRIGGKLSLEERKKLYFTQSLGLLLGTALIIGYYSLSMPGIKQPVIFAAIILALPLLLWAAARFEYLHLGQKG